MAMTVVAPHREPDRRSIERKRHALAVMRLQLAVQGRRIHQHNRSPAGWPERRRRVTTAVPVAVSDSVLSVSSVRAVPCQRPTANPSSSTPEIGRRHGWN